MTQALPREASGQANGPAREGRPIRVSRETRAVGSTAPECIVTGGKGTIPVGFGGKTYYVCCSGCKELFDDATMIGLADTWRGILAQLAEKPHGRLCELPLVATGRSETMLAEIPGPPPGAAAGVLIHEAVERDLRRWVSAKV